MIWPWGVLGYSLLAISALRPVTGHFAWVFCRSPNSLYGRKESPTADQWFGGFCIALAVVLLWPAALVWCVSARLLPTIGKERLEQLEADRKRLAALEKELGL